MINNVSYKAFVAPSDCKSDDPGNDIIPNNDVIGQDINDTANSVLGNTTGIDNTDTNTNPFDMQADGTVTAGTKIDPATGAVVEDPSTTPYYVKGIDEFMNDASVSGVNLKLSDFDDLKTMYQGAIDQLNSAKSDITDKLSAGGLTAVEVRNGRYVLKCIDNSLVKANDSLSKIDERKQETQASYQTEIQAFQDAAKLCYNSFNNATTAAQRSDIIQTSLQQADSNADGWIGEPDKGIRIDTDLTFADGSKGTGLYDADSGKYISKLNSDGTPMTQKWYNPSQDWTVSSHGLKEADASSSGTYNDDLVLQKDGSNTDGNHFEAQADIGIPDYVTVAADSSGQPLLNSNTSGLRYVPATFVQDSTGGIHQPPISSANASNYVQVRVDKVEVTSEQNADGKTYDNIYKFEASGGTILAQFRVLQGSTLGNALNGDQRTLSVVVDGSQMKSQFQQGFKSGVIDSIDSYYGVDLSKLKANSQGVDPTAAYNKTLEMFTQGSQSVTEGDKTDDGRMKATGLMVDLRKVQSGCFVTGSDDGNNLALLGDPAKQQRINSNDGTDKVNAFYQNGFHGGGGATMNAVFQTGGGDLYADNVTLAWRECSDTEAVTSVKVKAALDMYQDTKDPDLNGKPTNKLHTAPTFLYMTGGKEKYVDNPGELQDQETSNGTSTNDVNDDDWWYTQGDAHYTIPQATSSGTVGDADADSPEAIDSTKGMPFDDVEDNIEQKLTNLDSSDQDPYANITPDNLGGYYYNAMYTGMKSAFDELATGLHFKSDNYLDDPTGTTGGNGTTGGTGTTGGNGTTGGTDIANQLGDIANNGGQTS